MEDLLKVLCTLNGPKIEDVVLAPLYFCAETVFMLD